MTLSNIRVFFFRVQSALNLRPVFVVNVKTTVLRVGRM